MMSLNKSGFGVSVHKEVLKVKGNHPDGPIQSDQHPSWLNTETLGMFEQEKTPQGQGKCHVQAGQGEKAYFHLGLSIVRS